MVESVLPLIYNVARVFTFKTFEQELRESLSAKQSRALDSRGRRTLERFENR